MTKQNMGNDGLLPARWCQGVLRTAAKVNTIQWKKVKFDPPTVPETLKPIATKFGMDPEVGDPYPCAKFYYYPIRSFRSQPRPLPYRSCAYKVTRLVNFFRETAKFFLFCRAKAPVPIFTIRTSNDVVSRKNLLLGSRKQHFTFRPIFHKNAIFGQFLTRKFPDKKVLTMGMLICKLPLIVIVASSKFYSE